MRYGSIYLVVKDFDRSFDFYEKVLEIEVSVTNRNRFAFCQKKNVYWFILKNNLYAEIMGGHKNDWTGSE